MPRPQPAVKHPSLDGRGRHHGTAAESDRRAGTGKKGATHCGASARELLREEIANLSSFVVTAPPMVQKLLSGYAGIHADVSMTL